MTSCIYFLQAKSGGPIKIGTTTGDPRRRLTNLKTGSPEPINMIGAIEGTLAQEKQIHLLLSRYRVHGEWFEANAIVTAAIQEALRAGKAIYHPSTKPKHAHSLCLYRKRHNLSLGDLAKTIGTNKGYLSRIESGKAKPGPKMTQALSIATGIPASELRPDLAELFGGAQ